MLFRSSYDVIASTSEVHRVSVICKYYRIRFTNNSGSNQTYIRLQSLLGSQNPLTTKMSGTISEDQDTLITRTILAGETDGGQFYNVPVTPEGHLEVAVHSPRLPFGSLHTESLHPIFQTDAVYQVNSGQAYTTNILSGTVTASDSSFVITIVRPDDAEENGAGGGRARRGADPYRPVRPRERGGYRPYQARARRRRHRASRQGVPTGVENW